MQENRELRARQDILGMNNKQGSKVHLHIEEDGRRTQERKLEYLTVDTYGLHER